MTPTELAALYMDVVPDAMREYRKEMRTSRTGTLSVPQFRVLTRIRQNPVNNRRLAEEMGVSVAAMSRMVDQLRRHSLVERGAHETDRRQVLIKMTELGRATFEAFRCEARARLEKKFCKFSARQQSELKKALAFLAEAIAQMNLNPEGR